MKKIGQAGGQPFGGRQNFLSISTILSKKSKVIYHLRFFKTYRKFSSIFLLKLFVSIKKLFGCLGFLVSLKKIQYQIKGENRAKLKYK